MAVGSWIHRWLRPAIGSANTTGSMVPTKVVSRRYPTWGKSAASTKNRDVRVVVHQPADQRRQDDAAQPRADAGETGHRADRTARHDVGAERQRGRRPEPDRERRAADEHDTQPRLGHPHRRQTRERADDPAASTTRRACVKLPVRSSSRPDSQPPVRLPASVARNGIQPKSPMSRRLKPRCWTRYDGSQNR